MTTTTTRIESAVEQLRAILHDGPIDPQDAYRTICSLRDIASMGEQIAGRLVPAVRQSTGSDRNEPFDMSDAVEELCLTQVRFELAADTVNDALNAVSHLRF